ncbi:MAG: succinate dehydrogenase, cytochrome b556 subunit [Steroidobacteraceae bacterium]
MPQRPLSPHLSVYRMFRYTLFTSFANRITGVVLSLGLLVLVYWLMAVASGAAAYTRATAVLSLSLFKLLYATLLLTFSYHLVAGVRHLVWDTGRGLERHQSQRSAWIVGTLSVLLTIAFIYWAFCPGAHQS